MTIQNAYDNYMASDSAYWAPRTKFYYERNIGYFLQYLVSRFGKECSDIFIDDLPKKILIDYTVWLRSRDKFVDHPLRSSMNVNGRIKSNTVNTYMGAVKAFMNYLYKQNYTTVRFSEGLSLPKSDSDQIVPLLADEVRRMD